MSTIAQEILAIATEHGYTGAAQPTIAGAINALADTLAGSDATDGSTIAGAVKALAPYIGGGGGSFGELRPILQAAAAPNVGDSANALTPAVIVLVGTDVDTVLVSIDGSADDCTAASGAYVAIAPNDAGATGATGYLVTLDTETGKLTAVTQWDGEFTLVPDPTAQDFDLVGFTVPETQVGEFFVVVVSYA